MRYALIVLAAAAALACERAQQTDVPEGAAETPPPAPIDPRVVDPAEVAPITCAGFAERGLLVEGRTRAAILHELGAPQHSEARGIEQDSVFRFQYDGLVLGFHKPAGGSDVLDEARVRSRSWLRYALIGPGTPASGVEQTLGRPASRAADELVYVCHPHPANDDPVTFRIADGLVTEVVFTFYMD